MWHAFDTDQIKSIGEYLDAKSLTQYQSCSKFCLSGNKATYTEYVKLFKDGLDACQRKIADEWGDMKIKGVPWPYRYYLMKVAEARLDFVTSLTIKRVFVRVPDKFHLEVSDAWDAALGAGA